jgi:sterol desaturase/sphingolipid hydroxylase (fatty acid hydroxylase superfamily)
VAFTDWVLSNGDTLVLASFFGAYLVFGVLERLLPQRRINLRRRDRWPANLALTLLNLAMLSGLPVSLVVAARWAEDQGVGLLNQVALPLAIVIAVSLLGRAFISFGMHYLMHRVPLFWRLHRVHHFDTEIDVTTTVRFHPLEFVVNMLPAIAFVVVLGLEPWVLMLYEALDAGVTLFSHANIRLPAVVNRLLRFVVVTPDLHRVHHSTWQPETDSNFGAVFPFWDMVFSTYRPTTRQPLHSTDIGLAEPRGSETNSLLWLLVSPLKKSMSSAVAGLSNGGVAGPAIARPQQS